MSHPERWISQLSGHLVKMDWAKHLLAVFCNILSEPYLIFAIPEHHSFHVPEPYTDSDFTVLDCKARSHFFLHVRTCRVIFGKEDGCNSPLFFSNSGVSGQVSVLSCPSLASTVLVEFHTTSWAALARNLAEIKIRLWQNQEAKF